LRRHGSGGDDADELAEVPVAEDGSRPGGLQAVGASGYAAVMTSQGTTPLIRPVRPDEFVALGTLTVAAYHSLPTQMPHQRIYDEQLRDVATRAATSCVLVAVGAAGELLGGVTYVGGPEDPYSEKSSEGEAGIRMLAVEPARHDRGVGRALTQACIELARAAGRRRLVLHTGDRMAAAKHLYESIGFRREPAIDFSPAPGIDLIGYVLDLGAEAL
jgi:ribosomal protein S18 acetylase RimI-like enzyme